MPTGITKLLLDMDANSDVSEFPQQDMQIIDELFDVVSPSHKPENEIVIHRNQDLYKRKPRSIAKIPKYNCSEVVQSTSEKRRERVKVATRKCRRKQKEELLHLRRLVKELEDKKEMRANQCLTSDGSKVEPLKFDDFADIDWKQAFEDQERRILKLKNENKRLENEIVSFQNLISSGEATGFDSSSWLDRFDPCVKKLPVYIASL